MLAPTILYFLLPLLVVADTQGGNQGYNGGDDNPQDPDDAGAQGADKGSFSLSQGGLIAIIVVAVIVAVAGTASAILFWLAKKRQWNVRQSLRRASRRLTGRSDVSKRQNRRTGVRLNSPPPSKARAPSRTDKDVEKGLPDNAQQGKTTTTITSTFDIDTPTPKGWKSSVLGGKK
ncbi:hypothetical protein K491DRAFT_771312 [Lophiostoma macrostomum CBS 122681]|uniref:Mid2 domain-containing protein n=1 Tax=Lophiostoma macrostomum CBS 122681 TaxID=1314788 RepID=A0A6A6SQT6_9PLEO|nr:hypothetical protein K491DRAFT_771312 [Lophiostoma macrostomum CBS 122681]